MRKNKIILICVAVVLVIAIAVTTILAVNCNRKDPTPDPTPSEAKLQSITLDTSDVKTTFEYGETFTYDGLKVTANYDNDTTKQIDLKDVTISKPDTTRAGQRVVTVSYGGKTANYKITVNKRVQNITETPLLSITGENASAPYRVEAEKIDLEISKAVKEEGVTSFVSDAIEGEIVSEGKYLSGFGVQNNYFGFKFNSDKAYNGVTIVLRLAYKGEADTLKLVQVLNVYLNYKETSDTVEGTLLSVDGVILNKANGWTDVVIRDLSLKEGENTLNFNVLSNAAPAIDYIDIYVGSRYISSTVEISEKTTYVKEIEDFDTEKAVTRADVAKKWGLKDGQLFVETPTHESEGKTTSGGKSVGAIANGSQLSTTIRLSNDATVKLVFSAAKYIDYYVNQHWKFYIDGKQLEFVESVNIKGGDVTKDYYWDWIPTSLGNYNLSKGDHLLVVEATGTDCNVDFISFEVISWSSYDESGNSLEHVCQSVCSKCHKCTNLKCEEEVCEDKCQCPETIYDAVLTGTEKVMEFENVRDYFIYSIQAFLNAGRTEEGEFFVDKTATASNGQAICGFTMGSTFNFQFYLEEAGSYEIVLVGAIGQNYLIEKKLEITLDGTVLSCSGNLLGTAHDDVPAYWDWQSITLTSQSFTAGVHTLSIKVKEGTPNFDCIKFIPVSNG